MIEFGVSATKHLKMLCYFIKYQFQADYFFATLYVIISMGKRKALHPQGKDKNAKTLGHGQVLCTPIHLLGHMFFQKHTKLE